MWKPMIPAGSNEKTTDMSEPDYPRISVSPTLGQCFWAIYPNISRFFEEKKYPYMDMAVYVPVITSSTQLMSNEEIVKKRLVHDAHITGEYFILSDVKMVKHSEIRIFNCTKNKEIWFHPFNDKKYPKRFLSHEVDIRTLRTFGRTVPATKTSMVGSGNTAFSNSLFGLSDIFGFVGDIFSIFD